MSTWASSVIRPNSSMLSAPSAPSACQVAALSPPRMRISLLYLPIAEGLDAHHVVQVGLGDFSNSATYAKSALDAGVRIIDRDAFRREEVAAIAKRALDVAGAGGRKIYVDIDLDVADRTAVPGCPAAVPGGLGADEVRRFVREVASSKSVVAIDFTEVDVDQDTADQRTVRLVALLVLEALAGVARRST